MFSGLRRFLGLERRFNLTDYAGLIALFGGTPSAAGVPVSPETAMQNPVVLACVRVIAESLAQLPCHLYRRLPNDARERATDHPIEALLSDAANPWTPASEWRLIAATHLGLCGNSYSFVNRTGGAVRELIPLDWRHVQVQFNPVTMEPRFLVTGFDGQQQVYDRTQVLHIRGVGIGVFQGDGPVHLMREAIGLATILERHAAGLFARGARPGGLLKHPRKLAGDLMERLRASFERIYGGSEGAGKTAILEEGMEFVQLQLSSVDAQFLELRKFQVAEIARGYRIPLPFVGDLERATYNNAEQMGQQFLTFCLLPILRLFVDAMSITLLTPEERKEYYIEFLVDDIARADVAARYEAYTKAVGSGIMNPNEVRSLENKPPYAGGEVYTRQVNTAPVQQDPPQSRPRAVA